MAATGRIRRRDSVRCRSGSAAQDSVTGFNDLTPRLGVAYDLFGNGKTALKFSAGKYLSAATADGIYSSQNQGLNFVRTREPCVDRLERQLRRRLRPAEFCGAEHQRDRRRRLRGADRCEPELRQHRSRTPPRVDPAILSGWGVRPYNWNYGASVQHEVRPGVCRSTSATTVATGATSSSPTTSSSVPSDYDVWTVPVPNHPDLPNAGGTASYVAITPAASARGSRSFMTKEETVAGETRTAYWHGVDVNATARMANRLTLQMGTTHRPRRARYLRVVGSASAASVGSNRLDACDVTEPWLTAVRGLASYSNPEDRRAGQHDHSVDEDHRQRERQQRHVAHGNYQIPNTVVQTAARPPAGWRVGGPEHDGQSAGAERALSARTPHRGRHPARQDPAIRWPATRRRVRPLQPVQLEHHDDLSADVSCTRTTGRRGWTRRPFWTPRLARFNATLSF